MAKVAGEIWLTLVSGKIRVHALDNTGVTAYKDFSSQSVADDYTPVNGELLVHQNTSSPYDWRLWVGMDGHFWTTATAWQIDTGASGGGPGEIFVIPKGDTGGVGVGIQDSSMRVWFCPTWTEE